MTISTVHGRSKGWIQTALKTDKILFWNKAKGSQYLNSLGLQLPTRLNSDANLLRAHIKTETDLAQAKSDTKFSRQQKDYSSKSAYEAAKNAGETELTYHQWQQVRTPAR